MAALDELLELYKEQRLLRLKYDHLVDVCRSLKQTWHNRDSEGKIIKQRKKQTPDFEKCVRETPQIDLSLVSQPPDSPDLQLLESILSKAQKIRDEEEQKISRKKKLSFAAKSCQMAASVYQSHNHSNTVPSNHRNKEQSSKPFLQQKKMPLKPSKTKGERKPMEPARRDVNAAKHLNVLKPHSKPPTSSRLGKVRVGGEKGSSGVSVRVERHAGERDKEKSLDACGKPRSRNDHFVVTGGVGSAQMNICDSRVTSMHDDHAVHTPEDRSFNLLQHGSRLRMPSKYYSLCSSLAKIESHILPRRSDPTCETLKEHFAARLVPKGAEVSSKAIQLQLAREEYQILREELEGLSTQDWAVSDKTPWTDVHRVRMTVQHIQERATTLRRELASSEERVGEGRGGTKIEGVGVPNITTTEPPSLSPFTSSSFSSSTSLVEPPVVCSSLPSLLQLVELVHTHHMQRLEKAVLEFCVQGILPQIKTCSDEEERTSTKCIQLLSELAGEPKPIFTDQNYIVL